ncbi:hypothetical protein AVEN_160375-1 [Araneus ventricosus]|uniref:Teneurin-1-4-like galactose-binding domain-containing protein n=1 Tax=Araneus ventricosus TaxID=182803 RepID=A0A4Y2M743_ARAVE|nr:hypothetical protein AVEN_160375-1 [Araneus ventricosus]
MPIFSFILVESSRMVRISSLKSEDRGLEILFYPISTIYVEPNTLMHVDSVVMGEISVLLCCGSMEFEVPAKVLSSSSTHGLRGLVPLCSLIGIMPVPSVSCYGRRHEQEIGRINSETNRQALMSSFRTGCVNKSLLEWSLSYGFTSIRSTNAFDKFLYLDSGVARTSSTEGMRPSRNQLGKSASAKIGVFGYWNYQFHLRNPSLVKFNYTSARPPRGVGRRTGCPPTRYDFRDPQTKEMENRDPTRVGPIESGPACARQLLPKHDFKCIVTGLAWFHKREVYSSSLSGRVTVNGPASAVQVGKARMPSRDDDELKRRL